MTKFVLTKKKKKTNNVMKNNESTFTFKVDVSLFTSALCLGWGRVCVGEVYFQIFLLLVCAWFIFVEYSECSQSTHRSHALAMIPQARAPLILSHLI